MHSPSHRPSSSDAPNRYKELEAIVSELPESKREGTFEEVVATLAKAIGLTPDQLERKIRSSFTRNNNTPGYSAKTEGETFRIYGVFQMGDGNASIVIRRRGRAIGKTNDRYNQHSTGALDIHVYKIAGKQRNRETGTMEDMTNWHTSSTKLNRVSTVEYEGEAPYRVEAIPSIAQGVRESDVVKEVLEN